MPINNQFTNFATATTLITIGSGALSVTLANGNGALFPALAGGQYFYMVLSDSLTAPTVREIVKVNARAGDILTIVRAQDSTSAFAWPAGSFASLRLVNASIQDIVAASGASAAISGTPATGQAAEWTNATTVQGVSVVGTGSYVKATAPTIVSPTLTTPIFDTATGVNVNLSGTDTVNRFVLSGNISSPAWTTSGLRIKGIPATFTDTTSSGTVAAAYTDSFGGNTIAASSATTFTNYITAYFKEAVSGGANVTFSNKWALGADSLRVGITNPFTITNAGVVTAGGQITSTVTTGTAPLVIASATLVPNLYVARALIADSATVNPNLTGPITSVGNATAIAAQTGTGTTFVMATSPTLITPVLGVATGTSLALSGALTASTGSSAIAGAFTASGSMSGGNGTISLSDTGTGGAGIRFIGNGATTPSKTIRVNNGVMEWVNSAYSAVIATLTDAGVWSLGGAAGAESFRVDPVASCVNRLRALGGATGGGVYLEAIGSDTNIPVSIYAKNAGSITLNTGGGRDNAVQVKILDTVAAINFHQFNGSTTGNAINWTAAGTDADIAIRVAPKGIGRFLVDGGSAGSIPTLQVNCNGAQGVNILLSGNGAITPNKYICVNAGLLQFFDNAYANSILSLTDSGILQPKRISINANVNTSSWLTTGVSFASVAATYTDSSTPASTTVATAHINTFGIPTLAATNTLVTTTDSATVYIAGAPANGLNNTITNPWALLIGAGKSALAGAVRIGSTVAPASILDVTQNQNGPSFIRISNNDAGAAATATFRALNDTGAAFDIGVLGSGSATVGALAPNRSYFYTANTPGFALIAGGGPLSFASGGFAATMRLTSVGLRVGSDVDATAALDVTGTAKVSGVLRLASYTVAGLPAGTANDKAFVTDALAPAFGAAVAGGGAVRVPVYYTGAAWFVG